MVFSCTGSTFTALSLDYTTDGQITGTITAASDWSKYTKAKLHLNIVGKKLQKMGYEFQAINSQLQKHPQFVLFKKGEPTIFVLVKATNNIQNPKEYDVIWMETFKEHAKKQDAKVWFAGVGIANAESIENPVFKDQPYYVAFDDFIHIL